MMPFVVSHVLALDRVVHCSCTERSQGLGIRGRLLSSARFPYQSIQGAVLLPPRGRFCKQYVLRTDAFNRKVLGFFGLPYDGRHSNNCSALSFRSYHNGMQTGIPYHMLFSSSTAVGRGSGGHRVAASANQVASRGLLYYSSLFFLSVVATTALRSAVVQRLATPVRNDATSSRVIRVMAIDANWTFRLYPDWHIPWLIYATVALANFC